MNAREVGAYIRDQRLKARLSLHGMSSLAGVSIPYLSQVERGMRKPSADILYAIAKALRISASTLYVHAGILDDVTVPDVASAIMADPSITERQKQALVQIYEAFREEAGRDLTPVAREAAPVPAVPATGAASPKRPSRPKAVPSKVSAVQTSSAARRSRSRASAAGNPGGGAKSQAGNSRHPAPLRSSATNRRKEV
jgi:transcriptional regulator with XRE-family HTH domain